MLVERRAAREAEVDGLEADAEEVDRQLRRVVALGVVALLGASAVRTLAAVGARERAAALEVSAREEIAERHEAARGVRVELTQVRRDVRERGEAVGVHVRVLRPREVRLHRAHEDDDEERPERDGAEQPLAGTKGRGGW